MTPSQASLAHRNDRAGRSARSTEIVRRALSRALLLSPERVTGNLDRVRQAGLIDRPPNEWQLTLGAMRMWYRIVFRSETIGTCDAFQVRGTWRARLLEQRPLRFPFLVAERAIAPWDLTGLFSDPQRIVRHLLAAHHDGAQFVYDFQILAAHDGALERVRALAEEVVTRDTPRSRWLRDLTVYERYHENLLDAVERALRGERTLDEDSLHDPDISFLGFLEWCARQPTTPEATWRDWRQGRWSLAADGYGPGASC